MGKTQFLKKLGGVISKNSPIILTSTAIAGVLATVIFAVKATPRAMKNLEKEKPENGIFNRIKQVTRLCWRDYAPATATGVVTVVCIVGANHISLRRNAALAGLYSLTETAFKEYQGKVVETIGKNKELKVRDDISSDQIRNNPVSTNEVIFTGKGEVLCYDILSGRYFKSNIEHIRKAINDLNRELMCDMFVSLNDLYDRIGIANIRLGDELGWDVDKGLIDISFSSQISELGEPCLVLNYSVAPKFSNY